MGSTTTDLPSSPKNQLPWTLKLVLSITGLFGLLKAYQFIQVLVNFQQLVQIGIQIPPLLLALEGILWATAAAYLTWSIWTGKTRTPAVGTLLVLLYTAYSWLERLYIIQPEFLSRRWPVNLFATGLGLLAILGGLHHPESQEYFS